MADQELGNAVAEYQDALSDADRIASLKKVSSQVKHKALAEATAVSIIELVTEAITFGSDVQDAALSLLAYLVRRIHSQGHFSSLKVAAALNTVPNWPDTLNHLRKRGVPADVRIQLQTALERPTSAGSGGQSQGQSRAQPGLRPAAASSTSRPTSSGSGLSKSTASRTAAPAAVDNGLEPVYISSSANLDQICHEMLPDFEGKESEHNWPRREKHILKLRQITKGNAPSEFMNAYLANWKLLLDGIIKCATSLRTTFSTSAFLFIQESAAVVGHGFDSFVPRLLEVSVKMCSDTKLIAAQNGNNTVLVLIRNISWSRQMMSYISEASQDKNVRPREFSYGWIQAALNVHGQRKGVLEQAGGAETLEKCFRKGISDQNPKVRETAKKAFWDFHSVWPTRANALLTSLDERTQKSINILNPASGGGAVASGPPPSASGIKAKALANRPSIKDIMAAKRRESQKTAERPQSSLASYTSLEPKSTKKAPVPRAAAEPVNTGGLSSAPVRPGRKVVSRAVSKPELAASASDAGRPKTPFGSSGPRRPESRADEKRTDGPRRPAAPVSRAPLNAPRSLAKAIPQPSSLPASPEKAFASPAVRVPKGLGTDESPIPVRTQPLVDRSRFGSPASPERHFKTIESPLQQVSRFSTPARVYEDPRSSPSASPESNKARSPLVAARDISRKTERSTPDITSTSLARPTSGEGSSARALSTSPAKMPLGELSSNDVNTPAGSGAFDPRYAKLIDSGIVHMKSGRLDPHGYRRLHAVVLDQINALSSEKFDELLTTILQAAPVGQENSSGADLNLSGERILLQRLHLLTALRQSPLIQPYMARVLRAFIHIIRHEAIHNGHTYWVAEGQLREFAETCATAPNEVVRGVLAAPQDELHAVVLKAVSYLVENRAFDREDGEVVSMLAVLAGRAVALEKDVDARIQGHRLAKALGMPAIKKFLGEERSGVAFMLYQSMQDD